MPNLRHQDPGSQPRVGGLIRLNVHSTNGKDDKGEAVADIFRVDDGKIVEHWDVIQAVPEESANDNTMF